MLVKFSQPVSLFQHITVELDLADKTGKRIDLLTGKSISRYILPHIKKDISYSQYEHDAKTHYAFLYQYEVIGEAAPQISDVVNYLEKE